MTEGNKVGKVPPKKSKGKQARYTVEEMAKAILLAKGIVPEASKALGFSGSALDRHVAAHQELRDAVAQGRAQRLAEAEKMLAGMVTEANLGAVIFTLKCLGKNNGWVERQEIRHGAEDDHKLTIEMRRLPPLPTSPEPTPAPVPAPSIQVPEAGNYGER